MKSSDAQKSEVHDATADADGSPTAAGDEASTIARPHGPHTTPGDHSHWNPAPIGAGTHIVSDDTDVGGPLIIESDDPDLSPPRVPIDPFPTDRTPEIDAPIDAPIDAR